ncbi:UNVERIFIED_CONTAM: hypothetical protein GTU68_003044 [Idotea baltica]|nr:hypothetical protein [Idotea baltica]
MDAIKKINVKLPKKKGSQYPILIGKNLLNDIDNFSEFSNYSKVAVIYDSNVKDSYYLDLKSINKNIIGFEFNSNESNKNTDNLIKIWNFLNKNAFDRKSLVVNLGGGIIGDVGGFAAATYMRGIDFIQIPTTLLSQADASVGGKTGINLNGVKNICGAFSQPIKVVVDITTLETLPSNQILSGYAEIIKHGLIASDKHFNKVKLKVPDISDNESWLEILAETISIKAGVVEEDEKESGLRKILNFGHTAGHAFETLSHGDEYKSLLHGEAIALGMLFESRLSALRGFLLNSDLEIIENCLERLGYLKKLNLDFKYQDFFELLKMDKKNKDGDIKWTLLAKIGSAIFDQSVNLEMVEETFNNMFNK